MAIPVTNETNTALHAPVKQMRATITWQTSATETHTLTSEDKIISIKKEAEGYFCKSTLRKITIVLAGTDTNLLDQRVTVTPQVKTGADTWGDISWGSFTITEATVDEAKGTTTCVGYGGIAMMQSQEYSTGELTFPTTVAGLAQQIAAKFAVEIETDMTTLPNYDAPITEDLWAKISGTTYRDILEEIAGATGTIAVIGRGNDQLDFDLPPISAASETLTEANLISAKIGESWGKVSAVVLSRQPQGDNVEVIDQETASLPAGKNLFNNNASPIYLNNYNTAEPTPTGVRVINAKEKAAAATDAVFYIIGKASDYNGEKITVTYTASISDGNRTKPQVYIGLCKEGATARRSKVVVGGTGDKTIQWTVTPETDYPYLMLAFCSTANSGVASHIGDYSQYDDIMVEIADEPTPYEPFKANGRVDLVIANNEILDPQRETTATPILNAVKGWGYRNAEIRTEGHAYHEIGDRLDITVAGETYTTVVTKSTIQVDGGIKETLISTTPEIVPIDYAKTGGITKTVFRTELAVDKQEQRIDAIVSRQDATDASVQEQFTQVSQDLNSITATIQRSGGGNLIRNSVGYGKDTDGTLTIWEYGSGADTTTIRSQSSPASLNAGAVSGYEIMVTGAATISQVVALTPGETYTLSARAQKASTGSATITIANGTNSATLEFPDQTASTWGKQSVEFTPTEGANTVTISGTAGTTIEITDLMLATGGTTTWRQASGEIYNTQVSLDQDGVRVSSSVYSGDYVEITPLEFAGWSSASGTKKKVFTLNRETTEVEKLEARSQIKMPPIKIVPIDNSSYRGWAFVKEQ